MNGTIDGLVDFTEVEAHSAYAYVALMSVDPNPDDEWFSASMIVQRRIFEATNE